MLRYQVRYQVMKHFTGFKRIDHGVRTVEARDEREALARVRTLVPGSFGHWINGNATEGV